MIITIRLSQLIVLNRANQEYGDVDNYEVAFRDALNDNGLWRIVVNGYPYKAPAEMGLNNTDEAYIATKQAIYRYLDGTDETYYGGGGIGTAGTRVYNAIAHLLDLGYNGMDTIINATTSINQEKSLDFDNKNTNYYSSTYSVSANTIFQDYIVEIDTDKSGILITDENNNIKSKFNANEKFKILVPKNIVTTNFSIEINADLNCETKSVLYGESYDPELQDYIITTDPYEYVSTNTTLQVKKLTENGKIIITKVDADTKKAIKGVVFELYKDNKKIATATTGADGKVTFSKLDEGNYKILEASTASNYVLNENPITVEVPFNKTVEITAENQHKKGNLKIYKLDKDNQKIALPNVEFDLYSKEFNKVIETYTTNEKGEIFIEGLRIGDYILKEKNVNNKWYNMSEDIQIKVKHGKTTEVAVYNELKKGQIQVVKVNKDEPNIAIEGVKFNVLDKDKNILETIVTDSKGVAVSSQIPIKYEKIYLQEVETDKNYVLNNNLIEFKLQENKVITKTVENDVKKGKIKVLKKDEDNNKIGIEGATFEIINEQTNEVVDTITTRENGEAISKDLSILYTYKLKEKSTNNKYIYEEKTITDIKIEHNKILEFEVTNLLKKGQVRIIKKDLDNRNILLEGVTFEILDEKGNIVDTIKTDRRGQAVSKMLPCIDTQYVIREKTTKLEYNLAKEVNIVTLQQDKVKDMEIFNEKKKGVLQITKVDSKDHSKKLEGAIFAIYNENNELIQGIATDKNGVAKSGPLPYRSLLLSGSV